MDERITDYIAVINPNYYHDMMLEYARDHGFTVEYALKGDFNEIYRQLVQGITDSYELWRIRWDFTAFLPYLIDKFGYETLFNYNYLTDVESEEIDFDLYADEWVACLEETYGEYPKYSDYVEE